MAVNPISFRRPVAVDKSVHETVKRALQDHDNQLVDLNQANASLKSQIDALTAQLAALGKK